MTDDHNGTVTVLDDILQQLSHLNLTGRTTNETPLIAAGGFCDVFKGQLNANLKQGEVSLVKRSAPVIVAIKRLRVHLEHDPVYATRLAREIKLWARLDHPNVLRLLGYILQHGHFPALITEWMEYGMSMIFLRQHPEVHIFFMISGIANGLRYLHSMSVVHCDLKSANVLVSPAGVPLVADFGISDLQTASANVFATSTGHGIKGSLRWMASDLIQTGEHTNETDVWAFGMTVYEFLSQKIPYHHLRHDMQVLHALSAGDLPIIPDSVNRSGSFESELWKICQQCWNSDLQKRPDMNKISYDVLQSSPYRWCRIIPPTLLETQFKIVFSLEEYFAYLRKMPFSSRASTAFPEVPSDVALFDTGTSLLPLDKVNWVIWHLTSLLNDIPLGMVDAMQSACNESEYEDCWECICPINDSSHPFVWDTARCRSVRCSFIRLKYRKDVRVLGYPARTVFDVINDMDYVLGHAREYHFDLLTAGFGLSTLCHRFAALQSLVRRELPNQDIPIYGRSSLRKDSTNIFSQTSAEVRSPVSSSSSSHTPAPVPVNGNIFRSAEEIEEESRQRMEKLRLEDQEMTRKMQELIRREEALRKQEQEKKRRVEEEQVKLQMKIGDTRAVEPDRLLREQTTHATPKSANGHPNPNHSSTFTNPISQQANGHILHRPSVPPKLMKLKAPRSKYTYPSYTSTSTFSRSMSASPAPGRSTAKPTDRQSSINDTQRYHNYSEDALF